MKVLSRSVWYVIIALIFVVGCVITLARQKNYTSADVLAYLESIDVGYFDLKQEPNKEKTVEDKIEEARLKQIEDFRFEENVNQLLKKKLQEELDFAASNIAKEQNTLELELVTLKESSQKLLDKLELIKDSKDEEFGYLEYNVKDPEFSVYEYSYSSLEESKIKLFNPTTNENIIFTSIDENGFGEGRNFNDYITLINGITEIDNSKTTLVFTINNEEILNQLKDYFTKHLKSIKSISDKTKGKEYFSKVIFIKTPLLTSTNQKDDKISSIIKNFQIKTGLNNEKFALFINPKINEISNDFWKILFKSNKDIATVRLLSSENRENPTDHDIKSYIRKDNKLPTEEKELLEGEKESIKDLIDLTKISENLQDYQLDDKPESSIELSAIESSILFAKTEVFREGLRFSSYNIIGQTWNEAIGLDGIGDESLCYVANHIGYSCWGFPNIIATTVL